jgi:two-component system, sensor histidine kinase ChiS
LSVIVNFIDGQLITDIEDTGIGIEAEDLQKLFKFFGTLSKSRDINRGGMGLGLTISKMILQQLNGDITVKSEPKKGSIFTFRIPITEFKNSDEFLLRQKQMMNIILNNLKLSNHQKSISRSSSSDLLV